MPIWGSAMTEPQRSNTRPRRGDTRTPPVHPLCTAAAQNSEESL